MSDSQDSLEPRTPTDAELEALLDEESDEEFGQPRLDETTKAVLKDWSAQDFASIYTRFRPHLERHARRFLRNQSQVDEVVQDAFLYLMVTLPELDSELGVLRFLKWKTRLLCLDVIRASGRAQLSDIDAHPEFEALNADVSADIEQAEDAAIVRLALSKLNPRHREVLIASMYEEKTSAQIAAQVGLTENATNQLIFRARAAFKKALLGDDVDTTGMSTSKILSVAARKAALEAKKVGAQAMVFALFLILGIGAFINFTGRNAGQITAAPEPTPASTSAPAPAPAETVPPTKPENESVQNLATPVIKPSTSPSQSPRPSASPFNPWAADDILEDSVGTAEVFTATRVTSSIYKSQNYTVASNAGAIADFAFDADASAPFSNVKLGFLLEDQQYVAYPVANDFAVFTDKNGNDHYIFMAKVGVISDLMGNTWANTELANSHVKLEMVVNDEIGSLVASYLVISKY